MIHLFSLLLHQQLLPSLFLLFYRSIDVRQGHRPHVRRHKIDRRIILKFFMFVSDVFFPQQIANPWIRRFFSRVEFFGQVASSPQHRLPFWLLDIPNRHRCDFCAVFVVTCVPKLAANSQLPTIPYGCASKVRGCWWPVAWKEGVMYT